MTPLFALFLFVLIDVLGFSLVLPLFPYLRQDFGMSYTTLGYLQASNAVAQLISVPIIGSLSDKYGRKPMLLICVTGTLISFVMFAMADSVWMLFASRILDGALGGNISLAQACISGTFFRYLNQSNLIVLPLIVSADMTYFGAKRHDKGGRANEGHGAPWRCVWTWIHRWTCYRRHFSQIQPSSAILVGGILVLDQLNFHRTFHAGKPQAKLQFIIILPSARHREGDSLKLCIVDLIGSALGSLDRFYHF